MFLLCLEFQDGKMKILEILWNQSKQCFYNMGFSIPQIVGSWTTKPWLLLSFYQEQGMMSGSEILEGTSTAEEKWLLIISIERSIGNSTLRKWVTSIFPRSLITFYKWLERASLHILVIVKVQHRCSMPYHIMKVSLKIRLVYL